MKKASLIRSISIMIITLILFSGISLLSVNYINRHAAEDNIDSLMSIFVNEINKGATYSEIVDVPEDLKNKVRITVIREDGTVIADSAADELSMDNHLSREEVISARRGEDRKFIRYSNTLNMRMMYYAKVLSDNSILRLAVPISVVNRYIIGYYLLSVLLMVFIGIILLIISIRLNNSLLVPLYAIKATLNDISSGNFYTVLPITKYDEVNHILNQVSSISENIRKTMQQYYLEKNKLIYVLENINQGIIAVDKDNHIVLINRSADIFLSSNSSMLGKSVEYIFGREELVQSIQAVNSEGGFKSIYYTVEDTIYYCSISTVGNRSGLNEDISVIVLITDVTDIKNTEKMREEFFTNSSHELKTPLTAIKGFSELLSSSDNSQEDVIKYSQMITKNVNRMIDLINDMIKLSMIDNNVINESKTEIDLRKLIEEIISDHSGKARENNISIVIKGDAKIECYPNKTRELISNLIDNAIKYNKPNGRVNVSLTKEEGYIVLNVEDTGIGIEEKYHSRLFERFYRVDKGRSRRVGGTGLGLSIVKHIAIIHNWEIKLSSHLGVGTSIMIYIK